MSDHLSDPPPYEPPPPEEDFYEWENEEEGPRHNLLWTRIVALVAGLLLVFFLGRITAGGDDDGPDEAQLSALRQENQQLQTQVSDLQAELDALAEADSEPTETPPTDEGEEEGGDDTTTTAVDTYTVQAGQGFQQIAEDAMGDIGLAECIAEFNGLTLDSTITPGEELEIPAAEDC